MRSFYKKLIAFCLIGLFLYLALVLLTLHAAAIYKDGAAIMCEQKRLWARRSLRFEHTEASVLFMGNSSILSGLVPDIFDQQLAGHIKSYNLALPALGIEPAYFVLKDLIQRHECPTYVITPIITNDGKTASLFDYYGVQGMSFPGEFLSYLVNRQDKTVLFNYISPMRLYTHELMKYVMNFIIRRSNIAETQTKNEGILQQMFSDRGYYYIREQALYPNGRLPADYGIDPHADLRPIKAVHFDFDNDPYVKKFFDLAEKNHIHVLLINLVARQGTQAPYLECPDMYSIIASRYRNVVLTSTSWQRKFMPNDYFSDDVHLNPEGACLFTKMIAKEFSLAFRF